MVEIESIAKETILVVEDNEGLNRLIGKNLQRAGFQIDSALKGSEALEKIHSDPNVIMLLDYQLPDMTGNQVIESLIEAQLHVPFIMMTGQGDERVAVEIMKLGARDYVIKDGDFIDGLTQIVERVAKQAATERKLAETEAQLQESQIKLAGVVSSITDGMIMVNEEFNIIWANEVAENSFGSELVGKKCYTAYHDRDCVCDPCWVAETFIDGQVRNHETEAIVSDGTCKTFWSTTSVAARHPDGKPKMVVEVTRDITDRKNMEQQVLLSGRLAAVGQLAAGVAHELNNPLAAIQGYAQFLARKTELDDAIKDDVEIIYKEALRATKITANLLSFTHKHDPKRNMASINEIIENSLELQIYNMKINNIEVEMNLSEDLPETMADSHQLQQVFVNLINNAEQAITEANGKGKLTIETRQVGNIIRVTITDNGPGISEENLDQLFDPFFTTKEVGEGTGLGLSICFGIIEQHSGKIRADSKPGEGTTFTVELPIITVDEEVEIRTS